MHWQMFITPFLGALIGYITNKIAVEMLFRPLKPIMIGKLHIPFTPGIIPKEKKRLGKAIGDAVGNDLLTMESIKETLLSEKIENEIKKQVDSILENLSRDASSVKSTLYLHLDEFVITRLEEGIKSAVTKKISYGLITMNLGAIIAEEVLAAVNEKVQGTMLALFVNSSLVSQMIEEIQIRVNQYIQIHGEEKVGRFVDTEFSNLMDQPISLFFHEGNIRDIKEVVLHLYRTLINNYSDQFLNSLNLSQIVEEKVNAMDILEVEQLVLSIMEKELGAVVNLGALIGFILGLMNLLF
ncbi:MAG: DUF445 domain-containing protein [Eubacteriales bacterium]